MIIPRRSIVVCLSALLSVLFLCLQDWEEASLQNVATKTQMRAKKRAPPRVACLDVCFERKQQHKVRWGGDLLNMTDLGRLVRQARHEMEQKLKVDYGEDTFSNIFYVYGTSRGRKAFLPASGERGRHFYPKVQTKTQNENIDNAGSGSEGTRRGRRM